MAESRKVRFRAIRDINPEVPRPAFFSCTNLLQFQPNLLNIPEKKSFAVMATKERIARLATALSQKSVDCEFDSRWANALARGVMK